MFQMSRRESISDSFKFPPHIKATYEDILGKRRTFAGLGGWEWAFLVTSSINIAAAIGLTIERLTYYSSQAGDPDFTFALLLLINLVFCAFYVYNGVLREHQYEIIAFIASVILVLGYCTFEYIFNTSKRSKVKLARMIGCIILAPPNIYFAVKVAQRFGWLEFRIIGASPILQDMYRQQQVFMSLLTFDLQAAISFIILVLEHGVKVKREEAIALGIGVVFSVLWLIGSRIAVNRELKILTFIIAITGLIAPAFIITKITLSYLDRITEDMENDIIFYCLLTVGTSGVIVRFILLCELLIVYRNFGHGLSERAFAELVASETTSLLSGRSRKRW